MPKKKFTSTIDIDILDQVKIQAVKEHTNVSNIIENQLKRYLAEASTKNPPKDATNMNSKATE